MELTSYGLCVAAVQQTEEELCVLQSESFGLQKCSERIRSEVARAARGTAAGDANPPAAAGPGAWPKP